MSAAKHGRHIDLGLRVLRRRWRCHTIELRPITFDERASISFKFYRRVTHH